MFETSVVKARAIAAPRKAGVLSVSVALHTFIAAAAVAISVQSASFPLDAPNQMEVLRFVAMPRIEVPRGDPNAERNPVQKPPQQAAVKPQTPTAPPPETAPTQISDTVSPVAATDTAGPVGNPSSGSGEKWGSPDGDPNAIDIGQTIEQSPATVLPTRPLVPTGDVRAARVLSRVEPSYPRAALAGHIGGVVKVHCIIDKQGHLSDPEIVFSSFPAFNQPVMEALRRWTFAPGSLHGQPVDTYFELTITFTPR